MSTTLYFRNAAEQLIRPWNKTEEDFNDINMSEGNAHAIISALGITMEECTVTTPEELLDACNLYLTSELSTIIDNGKESKTEGNFTSFGRRAGYISEKINLIKEQCQQAIALGAVEAYFA